MTSTLNNSNNIVYNFTWKFKNEMYNLPNAYQYAYWIKNYWYKKFYKSSITKMDLGELLKAITSSGTFYLRNVRYHCL